jgi:hypothetical protein
MGFLNFFTSDRPSLGLVRLPPGSFTLDARGEIITSTLPQSFPKSWQREIGRQVLACFGRAKQAQMPLSELILHYAALKLLARELRGGAIIFLMPQTLTQPVKRN